MNFSNLKALGQQIGSSLSELEHSLAQPLVQPSSASSTPPARVASPSTPRIPTSSPRGSLDVNRSSPSSPSSSNPLPSASSVADSFRERLRKGRASLETGGKNNLDSQRKDSTEIERRVKPAVKEEQEEPPASTPEDVTAESAAQEAVELPVKVEAEAVKKEESEQVDPIDVAEPAVVVEPPDPSEDTPAAPPEVDDATPTPALPEDEQPPKDELSDPVLPPASPDPRFAISVTADATPDTTRSSTPAPPPAALTPDFEDTPAKGTSTRDPPLPSSPVLPTDAEPKGETAPSTTTDALPIEAEPSPIEDEPIPSPDTLVEVEPSTELSSTPLAAEEPPIAEPEPPNIVVPSSAPIKDHRLAEITTAYKRLQTLKSTLDRVVSEILPLSGVSDVDAFEGELRNLKGKAEMSMAEIGRLSAQLKQQTDRTDELRDAHRLESRSQSEQIDTLRDQLAQKDAALKLVSNQLSQSEAMTVAAQALVTKGVEDYDKLKIVAKEEEEKRIKALSLLRALRQKLVKSEKDKEEADREKEQLKQAEDKAQEMLKADRTRFDQEIVSMRAAQELQLTKMRQSFERETQSVRAQNEREMAARKGQYELEAITVKAGSAKELAAKEARIQQLEKTVRDVTTSRDVTFEQLQVRTAEMESSAEQQETLEARTGELQYELKEARDRSAALLEEIEELRKVKRDVSRDDSNTRRLLSEAEARHEAKVRDLEARARQLEKDRMETEEEMGRNLQDRLKEVERMRASLAQKDVDYAESVHSSQQREARIEQGETLRRELQAKLRAAEAMLESVREDAEKAAKAEAAAREELSDRVQRASLLETRLEEVQAKESSLRSSNKTLRDELRKLQSGVLLSEKQRNPGVGYFSSFNHSSSNIAAPTSSDPSSSGSQSSYIPGKLASSSPGEGTLNRGASTNGDEALNFEYLRNVILQFLERPEMRPHLVGVLGVILHFTPQEHRRLAAKA